MPKISSNPKSSLKEQFINVTGVSPASATKWLDKYNGSLENSIDAYLEYEHNKSKQITIDNRLVAIFDRYKDQDNEDIIGIEGTLKYLEDLEFDAEDIISLILAYFLQAPSMGVFAREPFLRNWQEKKIFDIPTMSSFIANLKNEILNNQDMYRDLYNYTFGFLMEVPGQRLLPSETAVDYWKLLLYNNAAFECAKTRLAQWFEFVLSEYKRGFSKDTWQMFYLFARDVIAADPDSLSGYDEMSAWPSVIDEYIEYLKENGLLRE
ncbi:Piso0_002760 [Millerozyma farinosa CBS 7064]|uniref:Defective in cullin neddylation protein n=1 Tax=Pichia sorbitophila (strain ATCC MYA-4447 / BCRC 22081 / CBS 7064 / NBRC 10061 / NRRL Y-12695) TaxID=559304 RepID=G8YDF6_PICSO|nr:Piso0_002760 [Millerozyma farinosa CBS 7064]